MKSNACNNMSRIESTKVGVSSLSKLLTCSFFANTTLFEPVEVRFHHSSESSQIFGLEVWHQNTSEPPQSVMIEIVLGILLLRRHR